MVESDVVAGWMKKSSRDIESARVLLERGLNDTGVYHCQQAAEKALKAYLAYRHEPVLKVHDLTALVKVCLSLDSDFEAMMNTAEILTPYATAFRYPGELSEPDCIDSEEALLLSERLLEFIHSKLDQPGS